MGAYLLDHDTMKHPESAQHIAVAVSGGIDSMALALQVKSWGVTHHVHITALHVDHKLRPESTNQAHQLQTWLKAHEIDCHILTVTTPLKEARNIQSAARDARYELMESWCIGQNIDHICLGHHADDQLETLLMRLGRGSGIDGLAAMRPISKRGDVSLLRPLLHQRKATLKEYLETQQQPWINDASNASDAYTRNRLRTLTPQLYTEGLTPERVTQVTRHLARASDYLHKQTHDWIEIHHCLQHHAFAVLPMESFIKTHKEIQLRIVKQLLYRLSPALPAIRFIHLDALVESMVTIETFATRSLHGCLIIRKKNNYYICREPSRIGDNVAIHHIWDHRFHVTKKTQHTLAGTFDAKHLFIGALGADGLHHLRQQQVTIPNWPATVLHGLPTLFHLEAVIAVPHIDYMSETCNDYGTILVSSVIEHDDAET